MPTSRPPCQPCVNMIILYYIITLLLVRSSARSCSSSSRLWLQAFHLNCCVDLMLVVSTIHVIFTLRQLQENGKPLMVIHHLDECPYSQALKKAFAASDEIQTMAEDNFIMLNVMHETVDKNLSPDGTYVPRIIFIDPSLTVRADITSRYKNRLYTYEPEDIPLLIENMKTAKQLLKSEL
uniref:Uncharacterized protein n=1 Tax=Eptatretus burgeri TaxID=7764 RepID=A0A8C4NLB6_EPTBU